VGGAYLAWRRVWVSRQQRAYRPRVRDAGLIFDDHLDVPLFAQQVMGAPTPAGPIFRRRALCQRDAGNNDRGHYGERVGA
jgi:hypothetical protein